MYPRSFLCEEAKIKQRTPLKKELCEIGEQAIWESRFTSFLTVQMNVAQNVNFFFNIVHFDVQKIRDVFLGFRIVQSVQKYFSLFPKLFNIVTHSSIQIKFNTKGPIIKINLVVVLLLMFYCFVIYICRVSS